MFLISTETGKLLSFVLKNKSTDVINAPPTLSTKNDSANGSLQTVSLLSKNLSVSNCNLWSCCITISLKEGTGDGNGVVVGVGLGEGWGEVVGAGVGAAVGLGVGVGSGSVNGGVVGGGGGGLGGVLPGSTVVLYLSPFLTIVLSPDNCSVTTRPFLVDTISVCDVCNNPCAWYVPVPYDAGDGKSVALEVILICLCPVGNFCALLFGRSKNALSRPLLSDLTNAAAPVWPSFVYVVLCGLTYSSTLIPSKNT